MYLSALATAHLLYVYKI